mgnify:CR=1 FL=1
MILKTAHFCLTISGTGLSVGAVNIQKLNLSSKYTELENINFNDVVILPSKWEPPMWYWYNCLSLFVQVEFDHNIKEWTIVSSTNYSDLDLTMKPGCDK